MKLNRNLSSLLLLSLCLQGCGKTTTSESTIEQTSSVSEQVSQEEQTTLKSIVELDSASIWAAPNTVAIMQDVDIISQCEYWGEQWLDNADKLHMMGIKGDTESTQLMITAKSDINSFTLDSGELTNEDGTSIIPVDNISIYAERYIEVRASSSSPKKASAFTGFYPDALVPIRSYKVRKENKVSKDNNQGIFITVDIPNDATPGNYTGTFKLNIDGTVTDIPVSLKVYNATMPETIHERSAFDIWGNQIGNGEIMLDEDDEVIDWFQRYYDFLVSKRVSPQHIGLDAIGDAYANAIVKYAQDPRITGYRIPYKATTIAEVTGSGVCNYDALVTQLTALANKNIELRQAGDQTTDLFKKGYYYFNVTIDEPSATKYDAVKYCDDAVTRAKQAVAPLLDDYPDLKDSLLKLPHLVTTRDNDILSGSVQTWCCQVQHYTSETVAAITNRKASKDLYYDGEGFWIYMTCDSNNPYPSFQLDDNLMGTRILSWMNFDYDISGTLFWNTCFYSYEDLHKGTITRDVWTSPLSWHNANGDGYLLYPGSKYGLDTPIATLRLENYREGTEDYEYLYMIKEAINNLTENYGLTINYEEFMDKFYNQLFKKYSIVPTTNVNTFLTVREDILDLLELVVNDPEKAVLELQK